MSPPPTTLADDPDLDEPDSPTVPPRSWGRATAFVAVALTVIVIWPILDTGHAALDLIWRPSGDWAALTMRVEDVGHLTPLVGPYSRFGWSHPGPLLYWMLAVPYHLLGDKPEALLAAAAWLNAITVAAIAAVAWRRGRLPLVAMTMATVAVLIHAMGPSMIRDPWNPFITLLPLGLTVMLAWSVIDGDHWMWPPLVFVTSFELQSHIGYLPIIAALAVTIAIITWRSSTDVSLLPTVPRRRWWVVGSSVAVLVGCWFPVLVDQLAGTGNLGSMARYFLDTGDRPAGLATALHIAAGQVRLLGAPWLGGAERAGLDGALLGSGFTALVVPVLAMAAAMWLAVRRRAVAALRFQILVVGATLGAIVATARVLGPVFDWVVRWWWILAALWWLSIAWALWSTLAARANRGSQRSRDLVATGVISVVAALLILGSVRPVVDQAAATPPPGASVGIVLEGFLAPVLDALEGSGPLLVVTTGSVRGDYGDALRLQLERAGIDVVVEDNLITHFGPERSESRRTPTGTLWIVSADAVDLFRSDRSMRFIAGWDPLSPEERNQFRIDQTVLQDQLIDAGRPDLAEALTNGGGGVDVEAVGLPGVDQELLRRVESIRRRGDPVAVFLGPPRLY